MKVCTYLSKQIEGGCVSYISANYLWSHLYKGDKKLLRIDFFSFNLDLHIHNRDFSFFWGEQLPPTSPLLGQILKFFKLNKGSPRQLKTFP